MQTLRRIWRSPKLRGTIRTLTFLSALNLGVTAAFFLPAARAAADDSVRQGGLELLRQLGPALVGPPEVATINGQRMSLAAKSTTLGVSEVLARFERHCREQSGGLAAELALLPAFDAISRKLPAELRDPATWLRTQNLDRDGKVGHIACIARGQSGGLKSYLDDVLAFIESGDVAKLGHARYVVARRDPSDQYTHVLSMWTEGEFNIPAMFSNEGDAPGNDPGQYSRPPASRRVLSASLAGQSFALRMYDSERSQQEVLAHYERELEPAGWHRHVLESPQPELDLNDYVRTFSKDGAALVVVTHVTPAEKTGVSLIEMGSRGFAQARHTGDLP